VADRYDRAIQTQGLLYKIERAEFRGPDRRFDISVPGDHHDRRIDAFFAKLLQGFKPVNARAEPYVQKYHREMLLRRKLQRGFARIGRFDRETFVLKHSAKRIANARLVINYKN